MDLDVAIATLEHRPAAYVLESSDKTYRYKGSCRDLPVRMRAHNEGQVSRTRKSQFKNLRRPIQGVPDHR